jgi:hypothetical protein
VARRPALWAPWQDPAAAAFEIGHVSHPLREGLRSRICLVPADHVSRSSTRCCRPSQHMLCGGWARVQGCSKLPGVRPHLHVAVRCARISKAGLLVLAPSHLLLNLAAWSLGHSV